jgi:hypothetical protein
MREMVIQNMQRHIEVDEPEEDDLEMQMLGHQFADNMEEVDEGGKSSDVDDEGDVDDE